MATEEGKNVTDQKPVNARRPGEEELDLARPVAERPDRDKWEDALARLRPYIEPPPDLRVHSVEGGIYTGILLVDKNEILAGVVIRTGHQAPPAPPRYERPSSLDSSSWRSSSPLARRFEEDEEDEEDENEKLPSWADDSRDRNEPWKR